ncbi:hypothetical protein JW758_03720 [Candidatus Peregrinibacteria bacterium]|nr:hypothetical protein [Candidatus Peregrinibacteria bacterium]
MKTLISILFTFLFISGCTIINDQLDEKSGDVQIAIDESDLYRYSEAQLEGKWVSADDPLSLIEFSGDLKIDYYEGVAISENQYFLINDILVVTTDEEEIEYSIIELTEDTLVLLYRVRGNTLVYNKLK